MDIIKELISEMENRITPPAARIYPSLEDYLKNDLTFISEEEPCSDSKILLEGMGIAYKDIKCLTFQTSEGTFVNGIQYPYDRGFEIMILFKGLMAQNMFDVKDIILISPEKKAFSINDLMGSKGILLEWIDYCFKGDPDTGIKIPFPGSRKNGFGSSEKHCKVPYIYENNWQLMRPIEFLTILHECGHTVRNSGYTLSEREAWGFAYHIYQQIQNEMNLPELNKRTISRTEMCLLTYDLAQLKNGFFGPTNSAFMDLALWDRRYRSLSSLKPEKIFSRALSLLVDYNPGIINGDFLDRFMCKAYLKVIMPFTKRYV